MKSMFSVKAIPILAAAVLAPLVSLAQTGGEQKTLTGVVSDAMCGQTHMMKDNPPPNACGTASSREPSTPSSRARTCTPLKGMRRSSTNTPRKKSP